MENNKNELQVKAEIAKELKRVDEMERYYKKRMGEVIQRFRCVTLLYDFVTCCSIDFSEQQKNNFYFPKEYEAYENSKLSIEDYYQVCIDELTTLKKHCSLNIGILNGKRKELKRELVKINRKINAKFVSFPETDDDIIEQIKKYGYISGIIIC